MFYRKLTDDLEVRLTIPQFAEEIFSLIDSNRAFLKQWLPWLDTVQRVEDTGAFSSLQLERFGRQESLNVTIFYQGQVAGIAGFNNLDHNKSIAYIGYWLAEPFNGKGIMIRVVEDLIVIARDIYNLKTVDIRCATGNAKSRAIPERLGFSYKRTIPDAEDLYGTLVDHEVYELELTK